MKKTIMTLAAVATVAAGALAMPGQAEARGRWVPGAVIGGLAAGAIIGGAIANSRHYGGYGYYAPETVYEPACGWTTERFWDGYGWRVRRYSTCGEYAPPPPVYYRHHRQPTPAP
jgi:hypothetical protein